METTDVSEVPSQISLKLPIKNHTLFRNKNKIEIKQTISSQIKIKKAKDSKFISKIKNDNPYVDSARKFS